MPVRVQHERQLGVLGVDRLAVLDHGHGELVEDQRLLGQLVVPGECGQPLRGLVDLRGVHGADLLQGQLSRGQAPLCVQREAHVGALEQLLVLLGLREEVRLARLQVQDHVDVVLLRGLHVRHELLHGGLGGVVAVRARFRGRRGGDDLERGDDLLLAVRLVALGKLLDPGHGRLGSLLTQRSEPGGARVPVQRHETPVREHGGAPADQLRWFLGGRGGAGLLGLRRRRLPGTVSALCFTP